MYARRLPGVENQARPRRYERARATLKVQKVYFQVCFGYLSSPANLEPVHALWAKFRVIKTYKIIYLTLPTYQSNYQSFNYLQARRSREEVEARFQHSWQATEFSFLLHLLYSFLGDTFGSLFLSCFITLLLYYFLLLFQHLLLSCFHQNPWWRTVRL